MNIFMATGEVSGDIQGAMLAKKLYELSHDIKIYGFGGLAMKDANVNILKDMSTFSTVGILEGINPVLLFKQLNAFYKLKDYISENKIDLMILVDNQGVNLLLAKFCKKHNIKYVYYFPPHVGIWGSWNAKKLISSELVITPFLFDHEVYKKHGCKSFYSGHPFIDLDYDKKIEPLTIDKKTYTVGILFGSRYQEIEALLPVFVKSMKLLYDMLSGDIRFVIPIAYPEYKEKILFLLDNYKDTMKDIPYQLLDFENKDDVYTHSDVLILSSGTASLLAACYGKPMVICYKISRVTFFIAKLLTKIKFIGMPNILLNEKVVPELLQSDCNSSVISSHIMEYITSKQFYDETSNKLLNVRNSFGEKNVLEKVALKILELKI